MNGLRDIRAMARWNSRSARAKLSRLWPASSIRAARWNAAEAAEKRKDGRTAREFEIALPHELTAEQRL
ncbi:hypothetical protein CNY89_22335, partial [Amaricoccus sp. HAR-UPW-R2A-40]